MGVDIGNDDQMSSEESLAELAALTESAGAEVAGAVSQRLKGIDPRTFIGRGKVAEVREMAHATGRHGAFPHEGSREDRQQNYFDSAALLPEVRVV